jgi:hypothetical protein
MRSRSLRSILVGGDRGLAHPVLQSLNVFVVMLLGCRLKRLYVAGSAEALDRYLTNAVAVAAAQLKKRRRCILVILKRVLDTVTHLA